jgi:broad specificity phosphatase PhoE
VRDPEPGYANASHRYNGRPLLGTRSILCKRIASDAATTNIDPRAPNPDPRMMLPSPAQDVCWLYLLRHGATDYNLQRPPILQGRTVDLSLSEEGRRQAERAAAFLEGAQLSAIYSSNLRRARETAEIVARMHRIPVAPRVELAEVDVGNWENRSWVEIERTEPEAFRLFHEDPGTHGYAGGENLSQVLKRVRPTFDDILANHMGQAVAVVGHNVVNRAYLSYLLDIPLSRARKVLQDNCCINVIRYREGEAAVWTLNATFHLR